MAEVLVYDPTMLIWIDESGCNRQNCMRNWAYGMRGVTPRDRRLLVMPILQPFNWINNPHSVVIVDNASIHHVGGVVDLIENQAGAWLLFLPPYSPDLNPAEEVLRLSLSKTMHCFKHAVHHEFS